MPELPEVQSVVRTLLPKLLSRKIAQIDLRRRDIVVPKNADFVRLAEKRTIKAISRRGKRIIFDLDNGNRFYIHLGMSGRLTIETPDAPLEPHTHLIFTIDKMHVRFVDPRRFGGVFWMGDGPADKDMGPEPLTLRPAQLARAIAGTKRAIKNVLLDQTVVAGLGNIYVDEALFASGIHPLRLAHTLSASEIAKLNRSIKTVLNRALKHNGSTLRDYRDADGSEGNFQKLHRVYDSEGKPCANCRTEIVRIVIGGRSSCFCPRCQPSPK